MNRKKRVLVIEDNRHLNHLIKAFLEKRGYKTASLYNGAKVIDMVAKFSPDIITLDIGLPHKDGFTICKEITRIFDIPIVFISAYEDKKTISKAINSNAVYYLTKSTGYKRLAKKIEDALRLFPNGAKENLKKELISAVESDIIIKKAA